MHGARAWQAAAWMMMAALAGGCAPRLRPAEPAAAAASTVQPMNRASTNTSVRSVAAATAPVQLLPDTTAVVINVAGIDALLAVVQLYWMFSDRDAEQLDKLPRSPAYKAELRKWQAVTARIRKREQAQRRIQVQQTIQLAQCVGVMTGNLREQPDGLVLAGGQLFGAGGLTRAIELGIDYFSQLPAADEGLHELRAVQAKHTGELQRIRVQDVATALKIPTPTL